MGITYRLAGRWLAVTTVSALALVACDTDEVTDDQPVNEPDSLEPGVEEDLEEALDTWTDAGIVDYELDVLFTCFCPAELSGPFTVTVRGGEVVAVEFATEADAANAGDPAPLLETPTVAGLFDALAEATQNERAEIDTVVYDDELGYPAEVFIDPQPNAVDDEFGWEVRGLRPLP